MHLRAVSSFVCGHPQILPQLAVKGLLALSGGWRFSDSTSWSRRGCARCAGCGNMPKNAFQMITYALRLRTQLFSNFVIHNILCVTIFVSF